MLLYIISRLTGLNISFYISYTFLFSKTYSDYFWILSSLHQFYQKKNILDLNFVVTNYEKALIFILQDVIFCTKQVICLWHVNKNILINCKPSFDIEESQQNFYNNWQRVLYSATKPIFEVKWVELQAKYKNDYQIAINYFENNLMTIQKNKVIKCYTNKLCQFGNTITSQAEEGHAKIQHQLNNILTSMILQFFFQLNKELKYAKLQAI